MKLKQYVILPDVHCPWHNRVLLKKICQLITDIRPHGIVLTGDFLDLFSISAHNKGKVVGGLDLNREYEVGRAVFGDLLSASGRTKERFFLYGNHEDRFLRWKADSENAKVGNAIESPEEALQLRENKFEVLTNWKDDTVTLGSHLELTHGIWCGRNPCRTHLENFEGSIMFGHTHGFGVFVSGKRASYNIGFLGNR